MSQRKSLPCLTSSIILSRDVSYKCIGEQDKTIKYWIREIFYFYPFQRNNIKKYMKSFLYIFHYID